MTASVRILQLAYMGTGSVLIFHVSQYGSDISLTDL